jgi:hypothetical protein
VLSRGKTKLSKEEPHAQEWKSRGRTWQKLSKKKVFIKKLQDENEDLKCSITWLKLQDEEL